MSRRLSSFDFLLKVAQAWAFQWYMIQLCSSSLKLRGANFTELLVTRAQHAWAHSCKNAFKSHLYLRHQTVPHGAVWNCLGCILIFTFSCGFAWTAWTHCRNSQKFGRSRVESSRMFNIFRTRLHAEWDLGKNHYYIMWSIHVSPTQILTPHLRPKFFFPNYLIKIIWII